MTMGYTAPSKKAIKDAIAGTGNPRLVDFYRNVQETSMFGSEARVPGENIVVGPDAYTSRKWFATLTVDADGKVVKVK
jgi:hypothetical protein